MTPQHGGVRLRYKQGVLNRIFASLLIPGCLLAASSSVLIRTTDGQRLEGQAELTLVVTQAGKPVKVAAADLLTVHSAAPASDAETAKITAGLAAIAGTDRAARDSAVLELTALGLPVLTPLLKALKDTDQHEPRPLYRLFERLIPSSADGFDRTASLVRLANGTALRGGLPTGSLKVKKADGSSVDVAWNSIRTLAVRRKAVSRTVGVHSLKHCVQIEYLDTGVVLSATSKLDSSAKGFVRLSWNDDGWATDADGLKKPGSPAYKTNLVNGHPFGALVGRIETGEMFTLGQKASKTGLAAGRLTLAVNDNGHWQNNVGTFAVTFTATDAYDLGDAQ